MRRFPLLISALGLFAGAEFPLSWSNRDQLGRGDERSLLFFLVNEWSFFITFSSLFQMLWLKAFHIIFMVAWMAGLLYLPRLFVYHASCEDEVGRSRFLVMERRLLYGIMHPALFFTLVSGIWMLWAYAWKAYESSHWLFIKLALVFCLIIYQFFCGRWFRAFKNGSNKHSHKFFRWVNEIPFLILIVITILVIVKPF